MCQQMMLVQHPTPKWSFPCGLFMIKYSQLIQSLLKNETGVPRQQTLWAQPITELVLRAFNPLPWEVDPRLFHTDIDISPSTRLKNSLDS